MLSLVLFCEDDFFCTSSSNNPSLSTLVSTALESPALAQSTNLGVTIMTIFVCFCIFYFEISILIFKKAVLNLHMCTLVIDRIFLAISFDFVRVLKKNEMKYLVLAVLAAKCLYMTLSPGKTHSKYIHETVDL